MTTATALRTWSAICDFLDDVEVRYVITIHAAAGPGSARGEGADHRSASL